MSRTDALLRFTPAGIYCARADVYIDPWKPVNRALITHGHSDHAYAGHKRYLAHTHTVDIMCHRLGKDNSYQRVEFGEEVLINGVSFTFIPAGHILGSAQIRVEYKGRIEVASGDYKLEDDGISGGYEPIPCHTLITECTFGLPIYQWNPMQQVKEDINRWIADNAAQGISSVLFGYSLGKAQRLLSVIESDLPIYVHGAVHHMTEVYRQSGIVLPETIYSPEKIRPNKPCIIVTPASVQSTTWLNKFRPYSTSFASGWMALRGPRRRRSVDRGFVMSDHMDWHGLETVMRECQPERVICTHGYTEIYAQYLLSQGIDAVTEKTEYETETAD